MARKPSQQLRLPAYLKWRDGRPRWEPGPRLRAAGWHGRDLKSATGGWMQLGEAIAAAQALNDEVTAWRAGGGKRGRPSPRRVARSVDALHNLWIESPRYQALAETTRRDYASKAAVFLDRFGAEPIEAIEAHHLYQWWETLHRDRGHAMANGVLAVARALLSHARRVGWRADNPARQLGLMSVPPRVVVWTPGEVECFARVGDALCPEAVDAVIIALHTGQRRGDVLALELDRVDGGRSRFKQAKTGARVTVPHTDQLAARLDAIRRRRASSRAGVVDLALARHVVLRPDGRVYTGDAYAKDFERVRKAAAAEMPSLANRRFQDLRDTAITRLALAGCPVAEIRAITGHELETVHQVLRHYLALDDRMASAAIDRLKTYMLEEGIAL